MALLITRFRYGIVAAIVFSALLHARALPRNSEPSPAEWTFNEDFSHGIAAWMSYPLAQDVGYDPSLFTTRVDGRAVLVRDVIAQGDLRLHVGLIRPLRFRATNTSHIRFSFELVVAGPVQRASLILGAKDGRRYTVQLAVKPGFQELDVSGAALGLRAAGADIDVIVIEAVVRKPTPGAHNRLIIHGFSVVAMRVPQIPLVVPRLVSSATGEQVATAAISAGSPLTVRTPATAGVSTATLFSPNGVQRSSQDLPAAADVTIDLGANPMPGLWHVVVANDTGRTEFDFLVMGSVPAHPRVLFGPARLQQLKTSPALQSLRDSIHRKASELENALAFNPSAGSNIALLSRDSVFSGLVAYFKLLDDYANVIGYNALDYRLNGNPHALDVARRALLTVSDWPTWTPPWFDAHGLHTYYEAGIFTQRVAFGYDLIADELGAADRERVAEAFWKNEIDPAVQEYFVNDRLPIAASNHMAHTIGGALAAALAIGNDVPSWNTKFAPAVGELLVAYDHLLRDLFAGDGSEAEPAGYEDFAMQGLSWGTAALHAFGIQSPRLGAMLDSFWWIQYSAVRPDQVLDTGDFNGNLSGLSGFAWPAEYSRNATLRELYDRINGAQSLDTIVNDKDRALEHTPTFLDLACCTWTQRPAAQPPPSRIFPGRGSAVLRSGWGSSDTVISLRAGPWLNHEHHDQGSFQVAAFGEKLIDEAGYTNYYTDPRYADYFTQSPGHNTIEVDDDAFSQKATDSRYWKSLQRCPRISTHTFSAAIDYVQADLTNAYDGALKSFTREYLFLKPDVFITYDRIASTQAHSFAYFLHLPTGAHADVAGNTARITGEHASALITSARQTWRDVIEPIPITAYRDLDRQQVWSRSALRLSSPSKTTATILVGMRYVPEGNSQEPLTVRRTPHATGFELHTNDIHVLALFRVTPGELVDNGITTDGEFLAINRRHGAKAVFTSKARNVREDGGGKFSASLPVNVAISYQSSVEDLWVSAEREVHVSITFNHRAKTVAVDGRGISNAGENSVSLKVGPGEHTIHAELQ